MWLFGVFIAAFSMYLNGLALNYASAVLITSTTGFTLVINDILAWAVFGEKFDFKKDGLSDIILSLGSIICALQQPKESTYPSDPEAMMEYQFGTLYDGKMIGFILILNVGHFIMIKTKKTTLKQLAVWWDDFASQISSVKHSDDFESTYYNSNHFNNCSRKSYNRK